MKYNFNNLQNTKKIADDTYTIDFKGRTLYFKTSLQNDSLTLRLFEELKIREIKFEEAKKHKLFESCLNIDDIAKILDHCILQGNAKLAEDKNKFHLILYNEFSEMEEENIFKTNSENLMSINNIINNYLAIQERLNIINNSLGKIQPNTNSQLTDLINYIDNLINGILKEQTEVEGTTDINNILDSRVVKKKNKSNLIR
jgi:hypothetical protein